VSKRAHWAVPALFSVAVAIAAGLTVRAAWPCSDPLKFGSFILSALTLVALAWYTYDTNQMARITRERWMRDAVLSTTYSLDLTGTPGDVGKTLLKLVNPSTLIVRARVKCNFAVYGVATKYGPLYDGEETWLVFPQQYSQGWFEVETILRSRGKTVSAMLSERTDANAKEQLTALLELEFWDELGNRRELPRRRHYFDFNLKHWGWIPSLSGEIS
jgi:hypothetical protein